MGIRISLPTLFKVTFVLLLGGSLAGQLPEAAHATQVVMGVKCQFYFSNSEKLPKAINELLEKNTNGLYVCTKKNDEIVRYYSLSPVWRGVHDVCGYGRSAPVYPQGTRHLKFSSQVFMASVKSDACPPPDDSRYILADSVSEDMFVRILDFFAYLKRSPKAFDESLAAHAVDKIPESDIDDVREILRRDDPKVVGMGVRSSFMITEIKGYNVVFTSRTSHRWVMGIDLTPDGFKIYELSKILD